MTPLEHEDLIEHLAYFFAGFTCMFVIMLLVGLAIWRLLDTFFHGNSNKDK